MLKLRQALNQPIDTASLAIFRILFGTLMCVEMLRYLCSGWIARYYIYPLFHFPYYGFDFIHPLPAVGMYCLFSLMLLLSLGIALGRYYRISCGLFLLGFLYIFLLEKARYLNHFYVVLLFLLGLWVSPLDRLLSLDVRTGRVKRADTIAAWPLYLFRGLIIVVYVYAGIAKLNTDWLNGQPLGLWFSSREELFLLGPLLAQPSAALFASYAGVVLDLLVSPLLLLKRTRPWALGALTLFHLSNAFIFSIGIFPWMMIAANLLFLDPTWPRQLPTVVNPWISPLGLESKSSPALDVSTKISTPGTLLLLGFTTLQLLIPLRHHLYPGDVAWTEEGHRYSWRMKLRSKKGRPEFYVRQQGETEKTRVYLPRYLTRKQIKKMACVPDMLVSFAHFLHDNIRESGEFFRPPQAKGEGPLRSRISETGEVEIYARTPCSLNGHEKSLLLDPSTNLATVEDSLWPKPWILAQGAITE
ncbi:MAG: HTTM domain-containing protein [Polyangiaceae bacterium]|nr:HTTM domain-containing protein [Polyangiaceae bacterium]